MNLRNWRNFEKIEQWDNPMKLILPENLLKLILLSNNSLTVLFLIHNLFEYRSNLTMIHQKYFCPDIKL